MKRYKLDYKSSIGIIEIEGSETAIDGINFAERGEIVNVVNVMHFHFPTPLKVLIFSKQFGMPYLV